MAIEIEREKTIKAPSWLVALSVLLVLAIIFLLASYVYFEVSRKKAEEKITQINNSVASLNEAIAQKETEFSAIQNKISDFKKLIFNHNDLTNVFKFIESKTIAEIWFNSFDFSEEEIGAVILKGFGPNFTSIGQQIEVLKKEDIIREIYLKDISISDEGKIIFEVKVIFDPKIFSFNKEQQ